MYKGEINVAQDQLASLLKTAENLRVKGLAEVSAGPGKDEDEEEEKVTSVTTSKVTSTNGAKGKTPNTSLMPPPPLTSTSKYAFPTFELNNSPPKATAAKGQSEVKRKRGRPRTLDSPGEVPDPCFTTSTSTTLADFGNHNNSKLAKLPFLNNLPLPLLNTLGKPAADSLMEPVLNEIKKRSEEKAASPTPSTSNVPAKSPVPSRSPLASPSGLGGQMLENRPGMPTPGGPLTPERVMQLGIVKMNDYLVSGSRQQFWEEYYVKVIMQVSYNSAHFPDIDANMFDFSLQGR